MTCLCGHRGFAGPSACVLEKGHEGDHKYGDYQQALAIAAAKELQSLRDQLAVAQAERDELMAALVAVSKCKAIFNMYPSRNKSRSYGAVVADAIAKGEK